MNLNECKQLVQFAVECLQEPDTVAFRFLALQKLKAALEGWPEADTETARLRAFETQARAVLGTPYEIRPATWKNADGSEVLLRVLDDAAVERLLKG